MSRPKKYVSYCYVADCWVAILIYELKVLRDVKERGRDIEGIIQQWFTFVKPSYTKYVEPQRRISGSSRSINFDGVLLKFCRYYHSERNREQDCYW